jgi:hypothetical protein
MLMALALQALVVLETLFSLRTKIEISYFQ